MPGLFSAALCASYLAVAGATVLDLPILVDNGYKVVELGIGTPSKSYRLLFDTGSSSSWAVDGTCTDTCPNVSGYDRVGYNTNGSTTGHYTGGYANIPYLGGTVAGPAVSEVWKASGLKWKQSFIAANESNWAALAADGFMGMAFSSIIDGGANTVVETLMAEGHLDEAKFGIYYGTEPEDTHGKPGDGVLTIGGSRESKYVKGELTTIPITRVDGGYDVWRSMILGVNGTRSVNGEAIEAETSFDIGNVVFDTGASSISFPDEQNLKVYESIGMNYTAILEGDHIPLCSEFNSSWSVSFSFGDYRDPQVVTLRGDQLKLPGFAYRDDACWPPFEGGNAAGFTLVGTRFLRNFYTVWDYGADATETDISNFDPTLSFGNLNCDETDE
ncbi:aspartic peptidase domain-containing protein [Thelonectria olida]|uniref:Aspartic peptidase domain-containing protein n=1 Tax=Thelonectria olida TaxID=1576542 RepID=A0A9P9ALD4_9HYPO|nr:aspartic peptidase domain-containing protein [Thelonectria olida]